MKEKAWLGKKISFYGTYKDFQDLVSSGKFFLTQIPFQRSREEVKHNYRNPDMAPPI